MDLFKVEQKQRLTWQASGCALEPLSSYLKALGLLRLLPDAKGWWQEGQFWIECSLSQDDAIAHLTKETELSPIVSPWNGTCGLWKKDDLLNRLASTKRTDRLTQAIDQAREVISQSGLKKQPKKGEAKTAFIQACQAQITDPDWRLWCDATLTLVELIGQTKTTIDFVFSRLLGTGGNIGAKDLGFNYLEAWGLLIELQTGEPTAQANDYWRAAVLGSCAPNTLAASALLAQYAPSADYVADAKAYPYQKSGGSSTAMSNPADAVLLIEGLLAFSGIAKRKLESEESAIANYSLAVNLAAGVADTCVSGELRAGVEEFWLPVWSEPKSFNGLRGDLLAELRGPLPRQAALDSFDFVAMLSTKAEQRKIQRWHRYAFFPRKGQSNFAVSLGAFTPKGYNLGAELNSYRRSLVKYAYSDKSPAKLRNLARQLEQQLFALASGHGRILPTLGLLGEIELYLTQSPGCQSIVRPLVQLDSEWVSRALDEGLEPTVRLALSLGSMWLRSRVSNARPGKDSRWYWAETPTQWGNELVANLIGLQRQWVTDRDQGREPYPANEIAPTFADIAAFLAGSIDEPWLTRLAAGFSLCKTPKGLGFQAETPAAELLKLPVVYSLAAYCQWSAVGIGPVLNLLSQGRSDAACTAITQRLRANSLNPFTELAGHINPRRIAAAISFPLAQSQLNQIENYLLEN